MLNQNIWHLSSSAVFIYHVSPVLKYEIERFPVLGIIRHHPQLSSRGSMNAIQGLLRETCQHYLKAMCKCRPACHQMFVAMLASSHQQQIMEKIYLNARARFEQVSAQVGLWPSHSSQVISKLSLGVIVSGLWNFCNFFPRPKTGDAAKAMAWRIEPRISAIKTGQDAQLWRWFAWQFLSSLGGPMVLQRSVHAPPGYITRLQNTRLWLIAFQFGFSLHVAAPSNGPA